jgi:hypothetical protein
MREEQAEGLPAHREREVTDVRSRDAAHDRGEIVGQDRDS